MRFRLSGMAVEAHPEGALFLPEPGVLIVSDLHLEKGTAFGRRGQLLPPYDSRATLARLEAVIARLRPARVVSLGDSFHDMGGPGRMDAADRATLARLVEGGDWVWIEGNHDPAPPESLGGRRLASLRLGDLVLRHEPAAGAAPGEIAGHLHPCARIAGRGRSVRARCFATDGERLVMPAFGAYAGGLNLQDPAFDPVFPRGAVALALARGAVWPAAGARLTPDCRGRSA